MESGDAAVANSSDPVARRIAGLQKSLQRDRKQSEKEARKLREENTRLQREMADLSSAVGDGQSKVSSPQVILSPFMHIAFVTKSGL